MHEWERIILMSIWSKFADVRDGDWIFFDGTENK